MEISLIPLWKQWHQKPDSGQFLKTTAAEKLWFNLTLVNNDVPPTDITQLSGHKNVQSITSYSTVSQKQQLNMSHTFTGLSSRENKLPSLALLFWRKESMSLTNWHLSNISSNIFSAKQASSTAAPFSFFGCCYKRRTYISVAINNLNQSPTLSVREARKP